LAFHAEARLVSLGVPVSSAETVVTNWTRHVFNTYAPAQPGPAPAEHLEGYYFSFKTGGSPREVVDRFYARARGDLVTQYREGPVGSLSPVDPREAVPMESFEVRGNSLGGGFGSLQSNGDFLWRNGYTSRKEFEKITHSEKIEIGEIGHCHFDPESKMFLDWDEVGELKMSYLASLKRMETVDKAKQLAPSAQAKLVSLGVREDRAEDVLKKWTKSVFKDYVTFPKDPAHTTTELAHLDGIYSTFKTINTANVVDRWEVRTRGNLITLYRSGSPGNPAGFDSAKAVPTDSFEIRGDKLLGPMPATLESNGDIVWTHGYISRKEPGPSVLQRALAILVLCFSWYKAYSAQVSLKVEDAEIRDQDQPFSSADYQAAD
jgi:hypothetical protein